MTIIISKNGKNAKKVDKSSFEYEDYLQRYIYDNPESVPLYDLKEDIKLLILTREFRTNSGPIDALGVDAEGEIYLIETKLYKNPDKRLVVAQVLDYGASLWNTYSDFSEFISFLNNEVNKKFQIGLNQRLKDFFGIDEAEVANLVENLRRNLSTGNFKFVVLMDKLHADLKDLIVFLNQNSRFDIFAVELEYYKHEEYEIMIPKLFGAEVKKDVNTNSISHRKWDESSFFEHAKSKLKPEELKALQLLYSFSKINADEITWGSGNTHGSFNPRFYKVSRKSLFSVNSEGHIWLNFNWLDDNEDTEQYRDKFGEALSKIKQLTIPADYKDRYYRVTIDKWGPVVDDFIQVVRELIK